MKIIKMYGPSISDPSKTVNRDVPEADVQAYRAIGYTEGSIEVEKEVKAGGPAPKVEDTKKPTKAKAK